jgi:hypothetical protein
VRRVPGKTEHMRAVFTLYVVLIATGVVTAVLVALSRT